MSYVSGNTLIQHAWQHGYAIGAFSAHNAETIRAILLAAEEAQALAKRYGLENRPPWKRWPRRGGTAREAR